MPKYLYLTKKDWVQPWVSGGRVPIYPARKYLSSVRFGTKTPDENLIHESPIDIRSLRQIGICAENVKGLTMIGCSGNGVVIPNFAGANFYVDDGLILSFCNELSPEICVRLGKRACVAIDDIDRLKCIIDNQLGVEGVASDCKYTIDHQRNHFLKSIEDKWQCEYRMFWPLQSERIIHLPPGVGKSINLEK